MSFIPLENVDYGSTGVDVDVDNVAILIEEEQNILDNNNHLENPNHISIKIRKLDATEYLVSIDPSNTILDLKTQIEHDHGEMVALQRLIYQGRELKDTDLIEECNIRTESVLHLVVRMHPPENINNNVQDNNNNNADVPNNNQNNVNDVSTFYVYRLCRLIRSFALINGFFFLLLTFLSSQPFLLLGVVGCGFGFYGAKKLNRYCLYVYMTWIAIEILFRIYIMQESNMLIWFFTLMMVVLDFYMMRCAGVVARLIPLLGSAQLNEITNLNNTNTQFI